MDLFSPPIFKCIFKKHSLRINDLNVWITSNILGKDVFFRITSHHALIIWKMEIQAVFAKRTFAINQDLTVPSVSLKYMLGKAF